jgi:hypothetical protein
MIMKIRFVTLFILLISVIPFAATAQNQSDHTDDEKSEESIILSPVADVQAYQMTDPGNYHSLNGLVIGKGMLGFESIYRQPGTRADLGFSLSAYYEADNSEFRDDNLLIGALNVGRNFSITEFTNLSGSTKLEIYFRIAPGFGVAGRGIFDNGNTQFFPGVTATTEFGAIYHFTERVSLFTNAGGRYYWFPGLDEMGVMGRPAVMFGLQFNLTGGFSPVRF